MTYRLAWSAVLAPILCLASWSIVESPKAGGAEVARSGKWLVIQERQPDGQWKVARHIWNQQP